MKVKTQGTRATDGLKYRIHSIKAVPGLLGSVHTYFLCDARNGKCVGVPYAYGSWDYVYVAYLGQVS